MSTQDISNVIAVATLLDRLFSTAGRATALLRSGNVTDEGLDELLAYDASVSQQIKDEVARQRQEKTAAG